MMTPQAEHAPSQDAPTGRCPSCADPDPQRRSWHHLALAKQEDLDSLRAHLTHEYVHLKEAGKKRQEAVDGICGWIAGLMEQYSHLRLVHEQTGAELIWWQVRDYMSTHREAIAEAAYVRAPEEYQVRRQQAPAVPGFQRVQPPPATPFPEEAPYPVDHRAWAADEDFVAERYAGEEPPEEDE
jgi:hypothetical protein